MKDKTLAIGGSIGLIIGLFLPIVSLPIVGQVNLIGNFTNPSSLAMLALSGLALFLAAKNRVADTIWPGGAAGVMLAYWFIRLQWTISQTKTAVSESMRDNPFAGLAQTAAASIQLQWGWLVLIAGAAAVIYAAVQARKNAISREEDGVTSDLRPIAGASIILAMIMPVSDAWSHLSASDQIGRQDTDLAADAAADANSDLVEGGSQSEEERSYIRDHLKLYDLNARYFDSMLDGRVPGVDFKIKNNGDRTLSEVEVLIRFLDSNGKPIAEENYYPVLVSNYNYSGDNSPLRPNYIWQQEKGQFYTAKSVPNEWKAGQVTGEIVHIEFGPNGDTQ